MKKSRCLLLLICLGLYHSCSHAMLARFFGAVSDIGLEEEILSTPEKTPEELYEDFTKNIEKNKRTSVLKELLEQGKKLESLEKKLEREKEEDAKELQYLQNSIAQEKQKHEEKKQKEKQEETKNVLMDKALILVEALSIKNSKDLEASKLLHMIYRALNKNNLKFKDFADIIRQTGISDIAHKKLKKGVKLKPLSQKSLETMRKLVKKGEISGNYKMRKIHFKRLFNTYDFSNDYNTENLALSCLTAKPCGKSYMPKKEKKGWFF